MLHQNLVMVSGVTNLTLQGLGTMETGPHETVMQSTVVIRCSGSTGGIMIIDSQSVTISTITVSGCEGQVPYQSYMYFTASLGLVNLQNTHLERISVQNSSGPGLFSSNSFNLFIEDSSFYYNQYNRTTCNIFVCLAGNNLLFDDTSSPLTGNNTLNIVSSNFSFNIGPQQRAAGTGFSIVLYNASYISDIRIDRVVAYSNSAVTGANMFFSIRDDSSPQVTISINNTQSLHGNMASFNGNVPKDFIQGAGLYFELLDEFDSELVKNINLFILNSNFFHNYAERGGGVYIDWDAKTAGQVIVSKCKFVSNTGTFGSAFYMQGFAYSSFLSTDANPLIFFSF